jgi:hypothetical protein
MATCRDNNIQNWLTNHKASAIIMNVVKNTTALRV